jgi:hypothetical protein
MNTKEGGATPKKEPNQKGSKGTPKERHKNKVILDQILI